MKALSTSGMGREDYHSFGKGVRARCFGYFPLGARVPRFRGGIETVSLRGRFGIALLRVTKQLRQ